MSRAEGTALVRFSTVVNEAFEYNHMSPQPGEADWIEGSLRITIAARQREGRAADVDIAREVREMRRWRTWACRRFEVA